MDIFDPFKYFPVSSPLVGKVPAQPQNFWIVAGTGQSDLTPLNAFDQALFTAGIGHLNLIQYSSIVPYTSKILPLPVQIKPGSRTGAILAIANGVHNELISAGIAIGNVLNQYYLVFEGHLKGSKEELVEKLRGMLIEGLSIRDADVSQDLFIKIQQLHVKQSFGCAIVAIVFDPTSYS